MSKKRWEDETLKPTLEKYPERKEALLDERERLNVPEDVKNAEPEFPGDRPFRVGTVLEQIQRRAAQELPGSFD